MAGQISPERAPLTKETVLRILDRAMTPEGPAPFFGEYLLTIRAGKPVALKPTRTIQSDDEVHALDL